MFAKKSIDGISEKSAVNIKDTIENILPMIRYELAFDKINLNIEIPDNLTVIQAAPRQLEEILFNLIVNAIHAIKETGKSGEIRINAKQVDHKIEIAIEDSGPGIPKDRIDYIFQPFHTTKKEGTGLGLYITERLVGCNSGRIFVESTVGKGSKFILEFKA